MLRRVFRIHCEWPTALKRMRVLCPMHNADHSDVRFNLRCFNSNFPAPPAIQLAELTGANSKDSLSSQWKRLPDRPRISQAQWAQSRAPDDENEAEFGSAIEVNEALVENYDIGPRPAGCRSRQELRGPPTPRPNADSRLPGSVRLQLKKATNAPSDNKNAPPSRVSVPSGSGFVEPS